MTRTSIDGGAAEARAAWSVVVLYEDAGARQRAVAFCDQLVSRFWTGYEFDLSWWSFASLDAIDSAQAAAAKVACADLMVLAATSEGDFPEPVKAWIEASLRQRGEREGVLVGLLEPAEVADSPEAPKPLYLRQAAHRGAMDYLTHVPQDLARPIPDSLDAYMKRAGQVTSLLDSILQQHPPPPNFSS